MGYTLLGTEPSYFTGKVRSYLRWKGVDFAERIATPEVYSEVIEPRVGFPVIPVLLTPDNEVVQDSHCIISFIERHERGPSVYPDGPVQKLVSLLFELYADEWLVIPAMHYRWNYNEEWILEEFGRIAAPDASVEEQRRIGRMTGDRFRSFVPRLGVSEETISGIEAHYEGFLADFSDHLRASPYLLGGRPTLGDFALFGPLYAHLYRDPHSGEIMRTLAPAVGDWVERMNEGEPARGELIGGDQVPETLLPILKRQMREQLPELLDTAKKFGEWAQVQPVGARVPRGLGEHGFTIGGQGGERAATSFSLWRLQAALDHLATLKGRDRALAEALLGTVGGERLTAFELPRRLQRRDFRLVLA
jgi:glutathione S-transferase